jgi:hypothetical protein
MNLNGTLTGWKSDKTSALVITSYQAWQQRFETNNGLNVSELGRGGCVSPAEKRLLLLRVSEDSRKSELFGIKSWYV